MRLRGRFTVWFALAAVVPIAAAALGTRQVLSDNYRETYARRRQAAERVARQQLAGMEERIARTVDKLAEPTYYFIGGLLLSFEKQEPESAIVKQVREDGAPLMRALGLDVLFVLDQGGVVLYAPHYRPAEQEVDQPLLARAKSTSGRAFFAREPMIEGDRIDQELVVEASHVARRGAYQVAVLGGHIVDRELLAGLRQDSAVNARVVDSHGAVLVAPSSPWAEAAGQGDLVRLPLDGADGRAVAWIEMSFSQAELQQVLRQVTWLSAGLGLAALVVTVLLGLWVSARMTRDLDELVVGAQAASRGDLDHQVPVRTRDEIGEVAEAFNTMMIDLRDSKERLVLAERVAAWQEVARRLAHEIKNPLTPIQMSVETLRKTWAVKHDSFDEIFEEFDPDGARGGRAAQAHRQRVLRVRAGAQADHAPARRQRGGCGHPGPVPGRGHGRARPGRGPARRRGRPRPAQPGALEPARERARRAAAARDRRRRR